MRKWFFSKGHGTRNDFVLLLDRHGMTPLSANQVRTLCDRRAGVGADGVLRAIKARHIPEWDGDPGLWFMDYRNADGSIAEMCGNGLRVFVRYLIEENIVTGGKVDIATRAGLRTVWQSPGGLLRASMGEVKVTGEVTIQHDGVTYSALKVDVGNPHAVVFLNDLAELESLSLLEQPSWLPADAFPEGANIEFVVPGEEGLTMRVYERGSGETMSCGTGVVAAAAAYAHSLDPEASRIKVEVPGGVLEVELAPEQAYLSGPAVIVGTGEANLPD